MAFSFCLLKASGKLKTDCGKRMYLLRWACQDMPGSTVEMVAARHMFDGSGKTIVATQGGAHTPHMDIPRYIRMHKTGSLKTDGIITHRVPLSRVNEAVDLMKAGEAGRVMVECSK